MSLRKFSQGLRSKYEEVLDSADIPDQVKDRIGDYLVKLLKSNWIQERFPKIMVTYGLQTIREAKKI